MFLFYFATALPGMLMLAGATSGSGISAQLTNIAQHAPQMRLSALLSVITIFDALVLGVALFAITRDYDLDLAVLALSCRVGEGVISAIHVLATLGLLSVATGAAIVGTDPGSAQVLAALLLNVHAWAMLLGATCFAVGSAVFCYLFLRARSIPAPLAWLGLVASLIMAVAVPAELAGYFEGALGWTLSMPMLVFEISLGFWLLIRGVPVRHTLPGIA
jgi:hypothetical protein